MSITRDGVYGNVIYGCGGCPEQPNWTWQVHVTSGSHHVTAAMETQNGILYKCTWACGADVICGNANNTGCTGSMGRNTQGNAVRAR